MVHAMSHGLTWKKLDLHVHTPGSTDFNGVGVSAAAIVQSAVAKGLDAIAITDHNSAAWVDQVIEAAKGSSLSVFPGVEITAAGGERGVHVVALFDCAASSKDVESLLTKVDILPRDQGNLDAISPKGVIHVIETIAALGGLAVLAHADSSKGVFDEMKGQQRIQAIRHPKLSAVELCSWQKSQKYVDGSDANYRRHIASYRASDNPDPKVGSGHSVQGIGSRFSWFKMDGMSLESLAQCFADPEIRILADELSPDRPERMYPRIRSLNVSTGFLAGLAFEFHAGVNSIIGGKGVGKSLLVEILRFALNQPSPIRHIREDMLGKLREQVGVGGIVRVEIQLATGETLSVAKEFDDDENPYWIEDEAGEDIGGDIARLFPILAYSQTEAHEIARSNDAQLSLIDSLIDLSGIQSDIAELRAKAAGTDRAIAEAAQSEETVAALGSEIATIKQQIKTLDAALKSDRHDELSRLEPKSRYLSATNDRVGALESIVSGALAQLSELDTIDANGFDPADVDVKSARAAISKIHQQVERGLQTLDQKIADAAGTLDDVASRWKKNVDAKRKEYAEWAATQGGNKTELNAKRTRALSELTKAQVRLQTETKRIEAKQKARARRDAWLDQLEAKEAELHGMRLTKYTEIQAGSNGRLQLDLVRGGNREPFHARLLELKIGSNLQDPTIRAFADSFTPRKLVKAVLEGDVTGISTQTGLTPKQVERFITTIRDGDDLLPLLRVEHELLCPDFPSIKYLKSDGTYHDLRHLSVGQKCTALLIVALSDDQRPIVLDQPEDALDTPSVFDDVTIRLRAKKTERQFILTTHNSTVAVVGDTDQYHVLTASAACSSLEVTGALDRPQVMRQVIQHLEGGSKPFAIKSKKYAPVGGS